MGADSRGEADRKAIQAIAAYIPDKVLSSNEGYAMTVGRLCELALRSASAPLSFEDVRYAIAVRMGGHTISAAHAPAWDNFLGLLRLVKASECALPATAPMSGDRALLPGLREALLWKPNTPQLENAMTYAWESALKSFISAIEKNAPLSETAPSETAKVPEGWRDVIAKARYGLGAGGGTGTAGAAYAQIELQIGGPLLDWVEEHLEELAAATTPDGNDSEQGGAR